MSKIVDALAEEVISIVVIAGDDEDITYRRRGATTLDWRAETPARGRK